MSPKKGEETKQIFLIDEAFGDVLKIIFTACAQQKFNHKRQNFKNMLTISKISFASKQYYSTVFYVFYWLLPQIHQTTPYYQNLPIFSFKINIYIGYFSTKFRYYFVQVHKIVSFKDKNLGIVKLEHQFSPHYDCASLPILKLVRNDLVTLSVGLTFLPRPLLFKLFN